MIKKIILVSIIYFLGILTPLIMQSIHEEKLKSNVIYDVKIIAEKINLRTDIGLDTKIVKEVYKDETFKVIKYYEGNLYNWYNIIYDDNKTGWIASNKNDSWVEVIEKKCE